MKITYIIKRDFSTEEFQLNKIALAIFKAMNAVGSGTKENSEEIALQVHEVLKHRKKEDIKYTPTIEEVQDIVEFSLMESKFPKVAKAYILYLLRIIYIRVLQLNCFHYVIGI